MSKMRAKKLVLTETLCVIPFDRVKRLNARVLLTVTLNLKYREEYTGIKQVHA